LARRLEPLRQARHVDRSPPVSGRWLPLQGLIFELRQCVRALRAAPGFTAVALGGLALGIGASTAIVSVVDAVVVRRLPFPNADRLVEVGEFNCKNPTPDGRNEVAPQNFLDWRDRQDVFTGLAAIGYAGVNLKPDAGQEPEILKAQTVTADFSPYSASLHSSVEVSLRIMSVTARPASRSSAPRFGSAVSAAR